MKLITISLATLLLLSTVTFGHQGISEYGKSDELKGGLKQPPGFVAQPRCGKTFGSFWVEVKH